MHIHYYNYKHSSLRITPIKTVITTGCIILIGLITGCESPEHHENKYLQQAEQHLQYNRLEKARIELKNTLQINPKSAEAHLLLGQLEEERREWRRAFSHYNKALEINPDLVDAHIKIGNLYLMQAGTILEQNQQEKDRLVEKINHHVKKAIDNSSANSEANLLIAALYILLKRETEAIDLLIRITNEDHSNEKSYLLLTQIYTEKNLLDEAYEVLKIGLNHLPESESIRVELSRNYASTGKIDLAIETMQGLSNEKPDSMNYSMSLAAYYMQAEQPLKAEMTIREAIYSSPDDISRYFILTDFLVKNASRDKAIDFLKSSIENNPENSDLHFKLASIYRNHDKSAELSTLEEITRKWEKRPAGIKALKILANTAYENSDYTEARNMIEQVLDENPHDSEALNILGKVSFKLKDYNTAITSFRSVLKTQPDLVETYQILADTYLLNGEVELSNETLKSAVNHTPNSTKGRLQLARFNLANNMPDEALKQVDTILKQNKHNTPALILKSEILATQNRLDELPEIFDKIKAINPQSAEGWFRMGRLHLARKQPDLARDEFLIAWDKAPSALDLLAELTDLDISLGNLTEAKNRLLKLLDKQPEHPEAHKFLGVIYLLEKQYQQAETEFLSQLEKSKNDPAIYLKLGEINELNGNKDKAKDYYKQGIQQTKNSIQLQFALARIMESQGNFSNAVDLYKDILHKEPANLVAANNLSIIYANHINSSENLMEAKILLEKLKSSKHPAIIDTLGWVHYKLGNIQQSIPLLEYATGRSPDNPTFNYHLGTVYAKAGNFELAKKQLELALSHDSFNQKTDVKMILDELPE